MKANFMNDIDRNTFGGALLYHIEGKDNASISTKFLVIWGYKSDRLYSHTLFIEHEIKLVWDEEKLKRLYDVYSNVGSWLLNDNTKVETMRTAPYKTFEMNIDIYRQKHDLSHRKPLWVDSNR
jgi:hypothetical protein